MSEIFGIIAGGLAVTGVLLNNRKMIGCFWLWIASNSISAGLHIDAGMWSLFARDVIFTVLAFEGIIRWRAKK